MISFCDLMLLLVKWFNISSMLFAYYLILVLLYVIT